jgi:hypothetical protein
MPAINILDTDP